MEEKDSYCVWEYHGGTWFTSCGCQKTSWYKFELFMKHLDTEPNCPLCHRRINVLRPKEE
jgi:hypothetical protein